MSNKRAARSSPVLMPPTGYRERIIHKQKLSFRTVYNKEIPVHDNGDEREQIYSSDQAFYLLDRERKSSSIPINAGPVGTRRNKFEDCFYSAQLRAYSTYRRAKSKARVLKTSTPSDAGNCRKRPLRSFRHR